MKFSVRKMNKADWPSVNSLVRKTWLDTYVTETVTKEDLVKYFDNQKGGNFNLIKGHFYYVATDNGKVVGVTIVFKKKESGHYYMKMLYVLPKYQRSGLGSRLMDKVTSKLPRPFKMSLDVSSENLKGKAFYEKKGFAKDDADLQEFKIGEKSMMVESYSLLQLS